MELPELQQLVAAGESERLEFKKSTGELKAGMTTLCALLNGVGGRVVFGVTPSGRIVGQQVTESTLQDVAQEIRKLEPPAHIEQTLVPVAEDRRAIFMPSNRIQPETPWDNIVAFADACRQMRGEREPERR